ncbi:PAS domain S-box protein [Fervidobacterium changbaicum]|uniref:histidine kinase n=2 Tax=Fervidobacterium changbaicum TaxID=310769 RepID=A0ABX5QT58_9BACT|nr:PAS domain S-box protein [Fervidobacterium changbaicum]
MIVMLNVSTTYIFLLLYNSIISLQTIAVFLKYRNKSISITGAIASFTVGFYSFGYAMELLNILSNNFDQAFFWYKIQYFAIPYLPVLWYFFVSSFAGIKISKRKVILLLIIPITTTLSVWTNNLHHLFLKAYLVEDKYIIRGPLYYLHILYSYVVSFAAYYIILRIAHKYRTIFRKITILHLLAAVVIPVMASAVYIIFNLPIDLLPFGLMVSIIIILFEAQRLHGFDLENEVKSIVYESSRDLIVVLDKEGYIVSANENFKRYAKDFLGNIDVLYKPAQNILSEECIGTIEKGQGVIERFGHYFEIWTSPLVSKNGKKNGTVVFFHDITDIKLSERARMIENERYKTLFEFAPVGILLEDEEGNIIDVNPEFCKINGKTKEELIGRNVTILAPKEDTERVRKNIQEILSGKKLIHTVRNVGKRGEIKYIELYETSIILPNGRKGILSIQKDITKQKVAQEVIRKLAKYQQIIVNLAINFINLPVEKLDEEISRAIELVAKELNVSRMRVYKFVKDKDSFTSINPWFYSSNPNESSKVEIDLQKVRGPELDNLMRGKQFVITKQSTQNQLILSLLGENYSALITPIKLENEVIGFVSAALKERRAWHPVEKNIFTLLASLIANIESKKRYEQELILAKKLAEEASVAKSNFLANMSHEIRTPLNGIVGFANLLAETELDEKQRKYLSTILKSTEVLLGVINDILDLAKIESGRLQLEFIESNLKAELQSSLMLYEAKAKEKNVDYEIYIDQSISDCLIFDSVRLQQVLFNLINNAIKFTPAGGLVSVRIEKVGEDDDYQYIKFSVKDTGIGIPKEKLEKIFEPFEQSDVSITRKYGGTGLGLSISKQLVELMDSKINVESEEGKGSNFYFTLKLKKCSKVPAKERKKPSEIKKYKAKVLIAEGFEVNRLLMTEVLKKFGIEPEFAFNGKEAMEKALKNNYDLIFMDILMPEMDGIEATKRIRQFNLKVPIVALTAHAMKNIKDEVLAAGMNDYVVKPIKLEEIESVLETYCGHLVEKPEDSETLKSGDQAVSVETEGKKAEKRQDITQDTIGSHIAKLKEELATAEKEYGLTPEFEKELLAMFVTSSKDSLSKIISALSMGDFETIQREAHSIKGAARSLGFAEIGELAKAIEYAARDKNAEFNYLEQVEKLSQEIAFVERLFEEKFKS